MIRYNQAFDLYHAVFRILHLLARFDENDIIEVDKIRIWDFYLLFPDKIGGIRLKRSESDIRKLMKEFIKNTDNPYDFIAEERKVFEKLRTYQISALTCIASYGLIDPLSLTQQIIVITNVSSLKDLVGKLTSLPAKERNVVSLMTSHFYCIPLYGADGLKNRTNLMESKYDV